MTKRGLVVLVLALLVLPMATAAPASAAPQYDLDLTSAASVVAGEPFDLTLQLRSLESDFPDVDGVVVDVAIVDGSATLVGGAPASSVAGVVTFPSLRIDATEAGDVQLSFTGPDVFLTEVVLEVSLAAVPSPATSTVTASDSMVAPHTDLVVTVMVRDGDGMAIAGVLVTLDDGDLATPAQTATSAADGSAPFSVSAAGGVVTYTATVAGTEIGAVSVEYGYPPNEFGHPPNPQIPETVDPLVPPSSTPPASNLLLPTVIESPDGRQVVFDPVTGVFDPVSTTPLAGMLPVAFTMTPSGQGSYSVGPGGDVIPTGDAPGFGSLLPGFLPPSSIITDILLHLQGIDDDLPNISISASAAAELAEVAGYWLVADDGSVYSFGRAPFLGSLGGYDLAAPIESIVGTPDGNGYWLVGADGGVFSFGDAGFHGSTGSLPLAAPVVDLVPTSTGEGYWLVAADGGVFSFGDAGFHGSTGARSLPAPVVGLVPTPTGRGYHLLGADLAVYPFGDAAG